MDADEARKAIAALGVRQTELARLLGVDPRTVRRWLEPGNHIPTLQAQLIRYWLGDKKDGKFWRPVPFCYPEAHRHAVFDIADGLVMDIMKITEHNHTAPVDWTDYLFDEMRYAISVAALKTLRKHAKYSRKAKSE